MVEQAWQALPAEKRRRAVQSLARIVGRQLEGPPERKEAGDESH
jgi:hypothetical protein